MPRDTSLHGPRQDQELEHELRGMLQGNRPSRAEEWRDPEPPADDDPPVWRGDPVSDTAESADLADRSTPEENA